MEGKLSELMYGKVVFEQPPTCHDAKEINYCMDSGESKDFDPLKNYFQN